jgi:hypothetical protein
MSKTTKKRKKKSTTAAPQKRGLGGLFLDSLRDFRPSRENLILVGVVLHVLIFMGFMAGLISVQAVERSRPFGASGAAQSDAAGAQGSSSLLDSLPLLGAYAAYTVSLVVFVLLSAKRAHPRAVRISLFLMTPGAMLVAYLLVRALRQSAA